MDLLIIKQGVLVVMGPFKDNRQEEVIERVSVSIMVVITMLIQAGKSIHI